MSEKGSESGSSSDSGDSGDGCSGDSLFESSEDENDQIIGKRKDGGGQAGERGGKRFKSDEAASRKEVLQKMRAYMIKEPNRECPLSKFQCTFAGVKKEAGFGGDMHDIVQQICQIFNKAEGTWLRLIK